MAKERKNSFFGGAAILAVGIAIVKVIGAIYKIPLTNTLGDGYADFYNAYNIYALMLTMSTAGLPVAVSKLISESSTLGRENQVRRIFRVSMSAFLVIGAVSFCAMFFFADQLADLQNDPLAALSIRVLSPAVFFVACLSAFRGYFQGHSRMAPTAVSQIIEALCKLFIGLSLAMLLLKLGQSEAVAAAGAIAGVTIGTVLAAAYMAAAWLKSRREGRIRSQDVPQPSGVILKNLLAIAIPITISSSMTSIITLIDSALVQGRLQNALGMTLDTSRNLYSAYTGVLNLYNLPSSLMVAITASVIPAVSGSLARRDKRGAGRIVGSSFRVSCLVTFPMGIGMSVLAEPIVRLLYPTKDAGLCGAMLSVLGIASIFVCVMLVANSVLQANGFVNLPIVVMLIGGILKITINYNLVGIEAVNIHGAPIGTLVCFGVVALLDLIIIYRVVPRCPSPGQIFLRPLIASVIMGGAAWASYGLLADVLGLGSSWAGNAVCLVAAIAIACVVYIILVLLLKAISKDDLALMPKGSKLAQLLHIQ